MISLRKKLTFVLALLAMMGAPCSVVLAQEGHELDPAAALSSALMAACRQNPAGFMNYLTPENAEAFRALGDIKKLDVLKRISLLDQPGRALISSDDKNHTVLRCESAGATSVFHFGEARVHENLAFIPVQVEGDRITEFGLVREAKSWRLLSLGLLLFNLPELEKQWAEQDLEAHEDAALRTVDGLADAVRTYQRAFGKLPESLAQLGPAPKEGISPAAADLISEELAAGHRGGYAYRYRILPAPQGGDPSFEIAATPEDYGRSGRRSFFLDGAGKMHAADKKGGVATPDDPAIAVPALPEP
jgi:hypothetical protein